MAFCTLWHQRLLDIFRQFYFAVYLCSLSGCVQLLLYMIFIAVQPHCHLLCQAKIYLLVHRTFSKRQNETKTQPEN